MGDRVADPKALGFAAFGIVAWMYSMLYAGWYMPADAEVTLHGVVTFALIGLLIAALASFLRGESWHAVFFMFWSAILWGYRASLRGGMMAPNSYSAWYFIAIALVSVFLLLAAMRMGLGLPVVLLSLTVTLSFVAQGLGGWLGGTFWLALGGYLGLATGLASLWAMIGAAGNLGGSASASPMGSAV